VDELRAEDIRLSFSPEVVVSSIVNSALPIDLATIAMLIDIASSFVKFSGSLFSEVYKGFTYARRGMASWNAIMSSVFMIC
jgi:hypothetical protein